MPINIPVPQEINNNGRIQMGGIQFIPSRLNTGELALVMPNSGNLPYFPVGALPLNQKCEFIFHLQHSNYVLY